jgi:guanylate kinase
VTPFLLVLSAPSGAGKTTIAQALLAAREDLGFSVSATTRSPRPGERNGVEYWFLTPEEFQRRVDADDFLEWAEYGERRYGTLRAEVDRVLAEGRHVLLDVEVAGARQIRARCQNVVSVFIIPPSARSLVERLGGRNTERGPDLARRLRRAVQELEAAAAYDYVVTNSDKTQAVAEVAAIIDAESRRPSRQPALETTLRSLIRDLADLATATERM